MGGVYPWPIITECSQISQAPLMPDTGSSNHKIIYHKKNAHIQPARTFRAETAREIYCANQRLEIPAQKSAGHHIMRPSPWQTGSVGRLG